MVRFHLTHHPPHRSPRPGRGSRFHLDLQPPTTGRHLSTSTDAQVQDRCDYAVREALDAADTVHGHGLSQEQCLSLPPKHRGGAGRWG